MDADDGIASQNPLDAVFEKAVKPFPDPEALRASLPPNMPIVIFAKNTDMVVKEEFRPSGFTVRIPLLEALKTSKASRWSRVGAFDFASMKVDEIGLVVLDGPAGTKDLKVITRAAGGQLLLADLASMLEAIGAMASMPLINSFPGSEMLVEGLRNGLKEAQADLMRSLAAPDASGRSFLDQFKEKGPTGLAKEPKGAKKSKATDKARPPKKAKAATRPKAVKKSKARKKSK
jgi:hypothetical protein